LVRQDGRALQDWGQADRKIRKDEPHEQSDAINAADIAEEMMMKINSTIFRKLLLRKNHGQ
jgi:hypothetical protein